MNRVTPFLFALGFGAACQRSRDVPATVIAAAGAAAAGVAAPEQHAPSEGVAGRPAGASHPKAATNVEAPEIVTRPSVVEGCQPCLVSISPRSPSYGVTFDVRDSEDGQVVRELRIAREDRPLAVAVLPVHHMTPVDDGDGFFFGPIDINFDGYSDLMLATSRGASNTYADYWIFSSGEFRYAGNYPLLRVDSVRRRLSTHENDGAAAYTNKVYVVDGSKLILSEQEDVRASEDTPGTLVKTRSTVDSHGKLTVIKRETVRAQ